MHSTVGPVMPCVFHDEEECNLIGHLKDRREWDGGTETAILGHWVEEPVILLVVIVRMVTETYQI